MKKAIIVVPAWEGPATNPKPTDVFMGRRLMEWTLAAANGAKTTRKVLVVSNHPETLKLASEQNAETLELKDPADSAKATEKLLRIGAKPDTPVATLSYATPLLTPNDIEETLEAFDNSNADILLSCSEMPPGRVWRKNGDVVPPAPNNAPNIPGGFLLENDIVRVSRMDAIVTPPSPDAQRKTALKALPEWKTLKPDTPENKALCEWHCRTKGIAKEIFSLKFADLELLAYDFDGVLTNNCAYLSQEGVETVKVNRSDGLVILKMAKMGLKQVIISKERNPVVLKRAEKLNLDVFHSCDDKVTAFNEYIEKHGVDKTKTAFFGNDLNDIEVMEEAALAVVPSDATPAAKAVADIITDAPGGGGVIREFYDMLSE